MQPFVAHTGVVAPLDRPNVDTDSVCPAQFLKRIERTGFGEFLFHSWRFLPDGRPNSDFILNKPPYQQSTILVAQRNFGCGSSREHAVWALQDYGFQAVIAPSFADIFHKNCFETGLVPVLLPQDQVDELIAKAQASPGYRLTVDLERCEVSDDQGHRLPFVVHNDPGTHEYRRYCIMNGLDDIALTLQLEDRITAYEQSQVR